MSRELMMLGSGHLLSGLDVATGTFALIVFSAGAASVVLIFLARMLLQRVGASGATALAVCGLVLAGGLGAYALVDRYTAREQAIERRAVEARAADLTARSLAAGSALGCLDAVASLVVETACEKPLFASPEAVAAAVAYVDARFSLLVASAALAERDPSYRPSVERLRRALEADRYGVVAHVLTTRGCSGDCAELRLLREAARVVANMKARTFETSVGMHALSWPQGAISAVTSPPPLLALPPPVTATAPPASPAPVTTGGSGNAGSSKFEFPSSNSIPAVSIMSAEPGAPPAGESRPAAAPPKRSAAAPAAAPAPVPPPSRRPGAREAAAPASAPPPPASLTPPEPPVELEYEPVGPPVRTGPDPHTVR